MSAKKITVLGFLLITLLFISTANAKEEPQSKLGQFSSWNILKGTSGGQTYCYAFSEPYYSLYTTTMSTRSPYLLVVYHGHRQVTFTSHLGFEITDKSKILLEVNDIDILLDSTPPYSGKTYSSAQDIQLLNEIIESNKYVKVKSFTKFGEYVADYYKVDGILKTINFMEKNCN
jgi:hypothetical protein